MAVQEKLKLKHPACESWNTREQLCLASSVLKSGDQNWMSISRSLKPFTDKDALRPPDWFSYNACNMQYKQLIESMDSPKRTRRDSGGSTCESIVRKLAQERIVELQQSLSAHQEEYKRLKTEVNLLKSGAQTDDKLQRMWLAIEQDERELKKRQQKQEILQLSSLAVPRKSEAESMEMGEVVDDEEKKNKGGGRSPLLTSLLKSPSPTMQMQTPNSVASPTIASLLGSSTKITTSQIAQSVTPQLHQLVSNAMSNTSTERPSVGAPTLSMLLEIPSNAQRATLPQIHNAITSEVRAVPDPNVQMIMAQMPNIPVNDNVVQMMNVIPCKDLMLGKIDKDEINDIIGDIEELIKEDTGSPQNRVLEPLNVPQEMVLREQLPNKGVTIVQDSPQSEIAIEEIDSSSSNIAEIIGTAAMEPVEPVEPKIVISDESTPKESEEATNDASALAESSTGESNLQQAEARHRDSALETTSNESPVVAGEKMDLEKEKSEVEETPKSQEVETANAREKTQIAEIGKEKVVEKKSEETEISVIAAEKTEVVPEPSKPEFREDESKEVVLAAPEKSLTDEAEKLEEEKEKKIEEPAKKDVENEPSEAIKKEEEEFEDSPKISEPEIPKQDSKGSDEEVETESEEVAEVEEVALALPLEEPQEKNNDGTIEKIAEEDSMKIEDEPLDVEREEAKEENEMKSEEFETENKIVLEVKEEKEVKEVEETKEEIEIKEVKEVEEKDEEKERVKSKVEEEKKDEERKVELKKESESEDEESTLAKISAGRAMKTYSKKQTVAMDSEPESEGSEGADYRAWKKSVMVCYNSFAMHKYASLFLKPITEDQAPGYHSIVFRPMDLITIKKNIDNGTIRSTNQFQRDVMLMFQNALMYNKQKTFVYQMAVSMQEECLEQMQILSEVSSEVTFRRETRTATNSSNDIADISAKRKRSLITPSPHETESPRAKKHKKSEND